MDKIIKLLQGNKPGMVFEKNTYLLEEGIFDSFGIMQLALTLEQEFEIEFSPLDIIPENFNTPEDIWNIVQEKMKEKSNE